MNPALVAGLASVSALVFLIVGVALGYWGNSRLNSRAIRATEDALTQQIEQARTRSNEILKESQLRAEEFRKEIEEERTNSARQARRERRDLQRIQRRIDRSAEESRTQQTDLKAFEERLQKADEELRERTATELERVSSMSKDSAKDLLFKRAEDENAYEFKRRFREDELRYQDEADDRAREILAASLQRLASDVVGEASVTSIPIPSEDVKGRLIGREGRNIRAIEANTGVDLLVDDTPDTVAISCFDPIRREVARVALVRLIKDGRIQPARIEDAVRKSQREVDIAVRKAGEDAVLDVGIRGLHPELTKMMGRLKYRYSYGENVLLHSTEVGHISGMLASQIGANAQTAKTAGFLHDIGKALTHEVEGPHAEIGADLAAQYDVHDNIVVAIREHHDREMTTPISFLVAAADAISAARPGARSDSNENYLKRLNELESVARGFDGVRRVFAIQAGREVRVLVDPQKITDADASVLSNDIAKAIEQRLQYPGLIKVIVIRESRAEAVAS